jgi:L-cysteate sulfo-lyase
MIEMENINELINRLPRVRLANLPTPLEEMPHLSKLLGGTRIWIKRDDLTGLIFGGNKVRKLEFEMAEAKNKGADVVITDGVLQSNHARTVVTAARKLGVKVVLVLRGKEPKEYDGNLLLDRIFGVDIRFVRAEWHEMGVITKKVVGELQEEGHTPYVIYFSSPLGSVGYVNAFLELITQARKTKFKIDRVVHAAGSGGTQAGLIVGNKVLEAGIEVIGISVEPDGDWLLNTTVEIADGCAKLLGLDFSITSEDVKLLYDYVGEGHGVLTEEVIDAIKLVAETEGILLDPVYTGKAMVGLIDLAKQGHFRRQENVVFLHTGGLPAIFAYKTRFKA